MRNFDFEPPHQEKCSFKNSLKQIKRWDHMLICEMITKPHKNNIIDGTPSECMLLRRGQGRGASTAKPCRRQNKIMRPFAGSHPAWQLRDGFFWRQLWRWRPSSCRSPSSLNLIASFGAMVLAAFFLPVPHPACLC